MDIRPVAGLSSGAEGWLRSLPADLARQRDVIAALLGRARSDPRVRVFLVGCSIGRGAADALSDVDALMGVREAAASEVMRESAAIVTGVGAVIDLFQEEMPPATPDRRRWHHTFAKYANRVELDLVIAALEEPWQPRPDWVVLHDPDGWVRGELKRSPATSADVRRWTYNCAVRLNACAKYLERRSLWEAQLCLERARGDYWCVRATADGVADPQYGLTAILDAPRPSLPARAASTLATLDRRALAHAGVALLELLRDAWSPALAAIGAQEAPPPALIGHVRDRLRSAAT